MESNNRQVQGLNSFESGHFSHQPKVCVCVCVCAAAEQIEWGTPIYCGCKLWLHLHVVEGGLWGGTEASCVWICLCICPSKQLFSYSFLCISSCFHHCRPLNAQRRDLLLTFHACCSKWFVGQIWFQIESPWAKKLKTIICYFTSIARNIKYLVTLLKIYRHNHNFFFMINVFFIYVLRFMKIVFFFLNYDYSF